ncbi:hypothetical protein NON20_07565 [Synechocystis sp. B12]|nr:hypothetical protein NON20_07565 [Synechocystis sp. B12]
MEGGNPDLFEQNNNDPAFLTRVRLGYNYFPDDDQSSGAAIGVEDLFVGQFPLSVSGDYYTNFAGQQGAGRICNTISCLWVGTSMSLPCLVTGRSPKMITTVRGLMWGQSGLGPFPHRSSGH